MSAGGAFGGNRGVRPVPPEKEKKDYLVCLKSTGFQSEKCRQFSKKYLECRMERNLMAKQDMSELGFRNVDEADTSPDMNSQLKSPPNEQKENKIARNVDEADTSPDMNSQLKNPPSEQKENKIAV